MKIHLTLLFSLLLLSACKSSGREEGDNQFTLDNGSLYFSQKFISSWGNDTTLPVCNECSKNIYTQYTPTGPMLFRQVNNENGDLVLLYATHAQHFFAVNTGSNQYTVRLHIEDKNLQLLINRQQIHLTLNEKVEFSLGSQSYFILLTKLNFIAIKKDGLEPQQTDYKANIIIWLNQKEWQG